MSRGFRTALQNSLLNSILGNPGSLGPGTVYIGLSTTTPAPDGSNFTEPGSFDYARVAVTNNDTEWPNASGGVKSNANIILFPQASGGSWGTVTHVGFFTLSSGGDLIAWGALDESRTINDTDQFRFLAGNCKLELLNVA